MLIKPLLTHEIGSLAKPSWRVKPFLNKPLNNDDINYAKKWIKFLNLQLDELIDILNKKQNFTEAEKNKIVYYSSLIATKMLEKAGLDVVYDGEQHRVEMYEYPIRWIEGFEFRGNVRSFDNKYYRKAAVTSKPRLRGLYHLDEYLTIKSFASKPIKLPITGAYTLTDWSFDEYYVRRVKRHKAMIGNVKSRNKARIDFLSDIAKRIIYPNLKALCNAGVEFLQIDEPAATTKRDEIDSFIQVTIESVSKLKGKTFFSMHICFSDYSLLFPKIERLQGIINELHLEYANRDTTELGVSANKRKGYEILKEISKYNFIVGLGVLDVHTNYIEPPKLIRDRILYALDIVKDPKKLFIAPDCGLRTRTWEVSYEKLKNMVEAVNMIK